MKTKPKIQFVLVHNYISWSPDTWLYAAIRFFTNSYWNHMVVHVDIENVPCVVDANFKGVVARGNRSQWYIKLDRTIAILQIPEIENLSEQEIVERLINLLHRGYDFKVYFYYIKYFITKLIWPKATVFSYKNNDRFYCFELCATLLKERFKEQLEKGQLIIGNDFVPYIKEIHIIKNGKRIN